MMDDALYRTMFDQDPSGRMVAAPDWRVLECNAALADLLGLDDLGQLIGRPLTDFCPSATPLNALLATVLEDGKTRGVAEIDMRRADGEVVPLGIALNGVFDADGKLSAVCGLLLGGSQAKEMKLRLLAQHRMEAIGRLAGGIAHDFNNLLTVMGGHGDRLVDALPADSPLQSSARAIRLATRRAASITRQLLAFSRRQVFQLRPIALHRLVADARPALESLLGETIQLRLTLPGDLPDIVGDPVQVEHVLSSLMMNAKEAVPDGGTVTIRVDTTTIAEPPTERPWVRLGPYVRIVVADNGPGLDQVTTAHLFEPFFTTKRLGQGSGLALASAYGIVKQSGGFIWAESELDLGSSFTILFPLVEAPEAATSAARPRPSSVRTILLVDHDEHERTITAVSLKLRGYEVLDAPTAERALEIFDAYTSRVHLLLVSVMSGEREGIDLAAHLKARDAGLRVLFMSGALSSEQRIALLGRPAIQKPFTAEALVERVSELLDAPPGSQPPVARVLSSPTR